MNEATRMKYLKLALQLFGAVFIFGVYVMMLIWPEAWAWEPRQPEYEQMIMGMYAVLGVFMILAAKDPLANRSLIWFTIWSSIVHAVIMLVQALRDDADRTNLIGDIPALFLVAIVLWVLMPRSTAAQT